MKMCQKHWDMMRQEVVDQGLGDWVAKDGETMAMQLTDQIKKGGEHTAVNYDPLMAAHQMILSRCMDMIGLGVLNPDFGCPICRFNEMRTEDGRCGCGRPDCEVTEPGSIPDHETWLVGEHSAVLAAKQYMTEQGWL